MTTTLPGWRPTAPSSHFADAWLERGAKLVIMTRGEAGALARSRHVSVAVPSVTVKVADTIGAGDTFSAALMARLDQHGLLTKPAVAALSEAEVTDALAFAAKAAGITSSRPGADPPWLNELA